MDIQITSVNIRYSANAISEVLVYFQAQDEQQRISLNGYIPLTSSEYEGNESTSSLLSLVRLELSSKLNLSN